MFELCSQPTEGIIRNIPARVIGKLTGKRHFYKTLRDAAELEYIPPTYLDSKEVPIFTDQLYFLKGNAGSRGEQVTAFTSYHELKATALTLKPKSYVIQQGIADLDLRAGCKYTLRVFVLQLADGRAFIYRRILGIQHTRKYDKTSTSHRIQIDHSKSTFFDASVHFERIIPVLVKTYGPFQDQIQYDGASYHLFGLDFLLDGSLKPWYLEINSFPNTSSFVADEREDLLVHLFLDFYHLVVSPRVSGSLEQHGNFQQLPFYVKKPAPSN